ncbi:hypothetical protein DPMN_122703 [Dreissena polymorpha]|uniref:Uncharacterized protein n=1 Tax=Dreissena polymorpha TaxID=45954 RepID=A0A9D4GSZ2_DREPO|nr:hypothetical protein DPMN_122703 [Dreissena polymorpha]
MAGNCPERKSTIDYLTPIDQPFTDYATVAELLDQSELFTKEVGQKYVLSTFDLGGCMKALPLIWKFPERYKYHVVTPGAFHTAMNYIGMLTKKQMFRVRICRDPHRSRVGYNRMPTKCT